MRRLGFSLLVILSLFPLSLLEARPFVLVISQDDITNSPDSDSANADPDSSEWDELGDSSDEELDPGSWRRIFEPDSSPEAAGESRYYSSVEKMIAAVSSGDEAMVEEAASEIEAVAASGGSPGDSAHARSVLGFLYGTGQMREKNKAKAFMYHFFAAQGGNMQSKMTLAYTYFKQDMYDKAVKLYSELADVAVKSFLISKDSPVLEPVRIHNGAEENKEAFRKFRGEEDEDFQIIEYQAEKGNAAAMYRMGLFYYFGLRGLRRDHAKAFKWFLKAVEKGEPRSMEVLGEIYARGAGVERNYTKALEWLTLASKQELYSAYNGLGYLYVKGYGVEERNYSKAKECFEKAADTEEPGGGQYNLGVVYLKGLGVKRDLKRACELFMDAANHGQPKAFYQLAKMFHKGIGLKKDLTMATVLYKLVAERGPWSSFSRWALESYLKGDVGKALFLYSRMAELGYEVAQSNAAWILDKYGEDNVCIGESGFCSDEERHHRAHSLWWQASEQGNEHAALLIGDAYYYGRGMEIDYVRAADAYTHAKAQKNAQAMFNLGYMYEHGLGLPLDLHLAKRYYDESLQADGNGKLPVTLALMSLWIRNNYADSFLVSFIDSLPGLFPRVEDWVDNVLLEEGNTTILTLVACLITVLYLRERQRRHAVVAGARARAGVGDVPAPQLPDDHVAPLVPN